MNFYQELFLVAFLAFLTYVHASIEARKKIEWEYFYEHGKSVNKKRRKLLVYIKDNFIILWHLSSLPKCPCAPCRTERKEGK